MPHDAIPSNKENSPMYRHNVLSGPTTFYSMGPRDNAYFLGHDAQLEGYPKYSGYPM